jgi:2,5-dichlorohydroquinone reductive dechlorinase
MTLSFSDLVQHANEALEVPPETHFANGSGKPRFEAYFATFSVCSHKVRAVLAEKKIPHIAHVMRLFARADSIPDNYLPGYVRMRLQGAPDARLVGAYTGQSSVESEGFDPCVVPTLVDHLHQRVVVDSAVICEYLDREAEQGQLLVPAALSSEISRQIKLVDQAPHVAVLYGKNPHGDTRPESIAKPIEGVHDRKIAYLKAAKAMVPDEPALIAAYNAKIKKEESAKGFIYERDQMLDAHLRMREHVSALQQQLATHSGTWVLGDTYTMADIMWSVSLFRLKWLGLGHLWEADSANARVAQYVEQAFMRPSFRQAVIDFPMSTPPTPHIETSANYAQNLHRLWRESTPG